MRGKRLEETMISVNKKTVKLVAEEGTASFEN
jgi:hypothetical protein